jgi:preprotein translocase subunit Sss1
MTANGTDALRSATAGQAQAPAPVQDRKVARINAAAEQRRQDRAAQVEIRAREAELALEQRRAEIALRHEQQQAKQAAKERRRESWRRTRSGLVAKINSAVPTVGRRVMIAGPILAPMAVAWIGQIGFAIGVLHWILPGAVVFAASWELTTAFCGWMYHQARQAGDHGNVFRAATWLSATGAGVMNYWHNCPLVLHLGSDGVVRKAIDVSPTPKAVAYGAMSLVGIAVWELYCSLVHRKALRARGIIPAARPRFSAACWFRYTHITWVAWSLSIKNGHTTAEQAWNAALRELARRALRKKEKETAKAGRTPIRVTVIHSNSSLVRRLGPTQWTRPPIVWLPAQQTAIAANSVANSRALLAPTRAPEIPPTQPEPGANSAPPTGANTGRQDTAKTVLAPGARNEADAAPTRGRRQTRTGAKTRRKNTRRSMDEWVRLADPIFHARMSALRRQPTGHEFAAAIKDAGLGTVSASTAKNIRTEILDRTPLADLDLRKDTARRGT